MKRGTIILLLLILVSMQFVSASIEINDNLKTQYNMGDNIELSGKIIATDDVSGHLQFAFMCNEEKNPLQLIPVDLSKKEDVAFSELSVPEFIITPNMKGLCFIQADILVNGASVDSAVSTNFEVTTDLKGKFELDTTRIQLGDSFTLAGNIYKIDGESMDGTAEIYFQQDDTEYLIERIDILEGALIFDHTFTMGYAGDYAINIIARDSDGNEQSFVNVANFNVEDQLHIIVNTNRNSVLPGEHINLFGSVKTVTQEPVKAASVVIQLNDNAYSAELSDSQFTYDLWVDDEITSGEHAVKVSVEDAQGNKGSIIVTIDVTPIATSLLNNLGPKSVKTEGIVNVEAILFDQADEIMDGTVYIEVTDSNNDIIEIIEINSGIEYEYQVLLLSEPGEWSIEAFFLDALDQKVLSEKETFNVEVVQGIDSYIEDGLLYISNTGNVKYTDDLEIEIASEDGFFTITKRKNLDPGESIVIDLTSEVPSGSYEVAIPTGFATNEHSVNIVDGKPRTKIGWLYTLFIIFFLVGLSYLLYAKFNTEKKEKKLSKHKKEPQAGVPVHKEKKQKIKLHDSNKKPESKKPSITFQDREQSIADFRERTLKEIKKVEAKEAKKTINTGLLEGKLGYVIGKNTPVRRADVPKKKEEPKSNFAAFFD